MSTAFNDKENFLAKWINNELNPEERADFEQSEEGKAYLKVIDSAEKLAIPSYDVEAELAKLKAKRLAKKSGKSIQMTSIWKFAAAAVFILSVTFYFIFRGSQMVEIEVPKGMSQVIELPDHSRVTINANSVLKYNSKTFTENRELWLSGEAFFEVTKGLNFEVKTDQGTVKVLGTSFNIWQRDQNFDVICYTGKVNVYNANTNENLLPGDGLRIEKGILTKNWRSMSDNSPAWIRGNTLLNDVSLQTALNELESIYDIDIISDIDIRNLKYNGAFPNSNITTAIALVLSSNNIEYSYNPEEKELRLTGFENQ